MEDKSLSKLILSMCKIGIIGFGGGSALVPIIEKTVNEKFSTIEKTDFDTDVMIASVTPGALPVELAAGVGKRLYKTKGLLLSAIAIAFPGAFLALILVALLNNQISNNMVNQIHFLSIGVYAYIGLIICEYVRSATVETEKKKINIYKVIVFISVVILSSGKTILQLIGINITNNYHDLSTLQIFIIAFFIILYTRGKFNCKNVFVSITLSIMYIFCNINSDYRESKIRVISLSMMILLTILVIFKTIRNSTSTCKINRSNIKDARSDILWCVGFLLIVSIPSFAIIKSLGFILRGMLSSIISFGGGDSYLSVADALFIGANLINSETFYNILVPIVNILPGSILCKTLTGIGYFIGYNFTSTVLGGICVAISGFAVSIAASCIIFSSVRSIYNQLESLSMFLLIKKVIRPIISGLLIKVFLSFMLQMVKTNCLKECYIFLIMTGLLCMDLFLKKKGIRNELVIVISCIVSIVVCNII